MLEKRPKYRHSLLLAVVLASLLFLGSCKTYPKLFQKKPHVETTTISCDELHAYNDSSRQELIKRFGDSCNMLSQAERDSMLRTLPMPSMCELKADSIIEFAMEYLGVPYKHGANGPNKFDCSSFTKYVFNRFGYRLSRTVLGQTQEGWMTIENTADLRRGDLVFYGSRKNPSRLGHVGIVVDNDPVGGYFTFIHSTVKLGVTISKSTEKYYRIRYMTARRVIPES